MKSSFTILLVTILLFACGQSPPASITTIGLTATHSIVPSATPTRTPGSTQTATPTEWIRIYPTKQVMVIYGEVARTQHSGLFYNRGYFDFSPSLVLYTDGQLIISGRYTKQLSPLETEAVAKKLEQLGFFHINDTPASDMENPLYILPTEPAAADSFRWLGEIIVNRQESKKIVYRQQWKEYLIQPMKDIISYLESFTSEGTVPYQPDRLLAGFIAENEIPIPEDAAVIPWPNDITPPSHGSRYDGVLYLEGAEALRLYDFKEENPDVYFVHEGIKFQLYLRPIYPHECHVYRYYSDSQQPFFICDDW